MGMKDNGEYIDDAIIPPWAIDAEDFVKQSRAALESDFVSEQIHHWIDLIFGYKQQGPEAVAANNCMNFPRNFLKLIKICVNSVLSFNI